MPYVLVVIDGNGESRHLCPEQRCCQHRCVMADKDMTECVMADKDVTECVMADKDVTECVMADKHVTECVMAGQHVTECVMADKHVTECVMADKDVTITIALTMPPPLVEVVASLRHHLYEEVVTPAGGTAYDYRGRHCACTSKCCTQHKHEQQG